MIFPFDPKEAGLLEALPTLFCLSILVGDVLLVLVREDRRALHDLIAGTCVRQYKPLLPDSD